MIHDRMRWLRHLLRRMHPRRSPRQPRLVNVRLSLYDRRASEVTWYSPTLGVAKRLHLYLPPSYANTTQRYPVLYLLRGHEREWLNLNEDASRGDQNVLDVYERLYSNGEIGPLILVIPSLTSDDGRVHGLGIDHLKPWIGPQAGGTGTGLWEQYLVHDVIPFVDSHWRTLASGEHRGVDGFSIGGAVAAKVAAKLPGVFRTVGAYDGTFFFSSADGTSVCPDDSILTNPIWDPAFGAPRDLAHATANSPANLILHANRAALQRITWMVQYGRECIEPNGSNYYRGRHLTRALRKRGIENSLAEEVLQDGDHTWRTADRHMAMTLATHWHVLRRTA